ncbi:hypothetical protein FN846DRAFT_983572 [Sphaerosporella brunnea]|uniref:Uncharacterized protein n=1 Tax=Sphaerosporella brunnea TaxID=1250544 RepID=A0A5J5FA09_9PEZI|nr:hypothetical protein FN846DRAFT_983572 [Sphaerosporella brunnea]
MPRNRRSHQKRSQKTPKERRNTQNEQSNTPNEDSDTQNEQSEIRHAQSEAQKQQAHKERIRALVNNFVFGTGEPVSTLKDSDPVPGFAEGRAYAKELEAALPGAGGKLPARDPRFVARTKGPEEETFDLWRQGRAGRLEVRPLGEEHADMSPGRGRRRTQRTESSDIAESFELDDDAPAERGRRRMHSDESSDIVEPLQWSDLDEDGPPERARTPEVRMDLSDDEFGGLIGDPFVNATPSPSATGNASTWSAGDIEATDTETAYRPQPSWESGRLKTTWSRPPSAVPTEATPTETASLSPPSRESRRLTTTLSRTPSAVPTKATTTKTAYRTRPSGEHRRGAATSSRTSRPRMQQYSEAAASPPPAGTRHPLRSPPRKLPRKEMRTPTARRTNFAVDLSRPTPPLPREAFEDVALGSPPPEEVVGSDQVRGFAEKRNIKLPK